MKGSCLWCKGSEWGLCARVGRHNNAQSEFTQTSPKQGYNFNTPLDAPFQGLSESISKFEIGPLFKISRLGTFFEF